MRHRLTQPATVQGRMERNRILSVGYIPLHDVSPLTGDLAGKTALSPPGATIRGVSASEHHYSIHFPNSQENGGLTRCRQETPARSWRAAAPTDSRCHRLQAAHRGARTRSRGRLRCLCPLPPVQKLVVNAKQVKDLADSVINQVINGPGVGVEGWHRWVDDSAHFGRRQH